MWHLIDLAPMIGGAFNLTAAGIGLVTFRLGRRSPSRRVASGPTLKDAENG
ncbi:hypothetical protein AB0M44_02620 [Streptosporangium subroseum]|uniref:hypothetical protein n=1 Tax=Streptosporangium subroseum TaxID=106412 RepID=UPI00343AA15E